MSMELLPALILVAVEDDLHVRRDDQPIGTSDTDEVIDLVHPRLLRGPEPDDRVVILIDIAVVELQEEGQQRVVPADDPLALVVGDLVPTHGDARRSTWRCW